MGLVVPHMTRVYIAEGKIHSRYVEEAYIYRQTKSLDS